MKTASEVIVMIEKVDPTIEELRILALLLTASKGMPPPYGIMSCTVFLMAEISSKQLINSLQKDPKPDIIAFRLWENYVTKLRSERMKSDLLS